MRFVDRIRQAIRAFNSATTEVAAGFNDDKLLEWLGIDRTGLNQKEINEITYFTCIKKLSETIGKLPIKYYQEGENGKARADPDKNYYLVATRPNKFMTPTTFWTAVEYNTQHYGNGYVWIQDVYDKIHGYKKIALWIMPSQDVTVLVDDRGIFGQQNDVYYQYADQYTHETYVFPSRSVMHFKTWLTLDGYTGESVRSILKHTIDGSLESQMFMNNLYKQGLTASMALQYTADIDEIKIKALQHKYEKYLTGAKNAGKIVPVPIGMTLTPLKMSLADAQFFELKKYSALQIAGAFGIKPNQINNYEKSSYASAEMQQLDFLVDTASIRLKMYEEEIGYKMLGPGGIINGKYFKFNEKALLRTDSETQAKILTSYVNNGIYTPDEARDYLDMSNIPGGNKAIVNGNYIPLMDVGKQYDSKGGDRNEESQNQGGHHRE